MLNAGQDMAEMKFEAMGRYIYGAHRFGGDMNDVLRWMAGDLGVATPLTDDEDAGRVLWTAFFAKYTTLEALQENHARFMDSLRTRPA